MAVARAEVQIKWDGTSDSKAITSGSNATSEEAAISATAFQVELLFKASNGGTPASGDTINFRVLATHGDPDGASTDEFGSIQHAAIVFRGDTNAENPAISNPVRLDYVPTKIKIYAKSNAASNSITVSATILEHTA